MKDDAIHFKHVQPYSKNFAMQDVLAFRKCPCNCGNSKGNCHSVFAHQSHKFLPSVMPSKAELEKLDLYIRLEIFLETLS